MKTAWRTPRLNRYLFGSMVWFIPVRAVMLATIWVAWNGGGVLAVGGVLAAAQVAAQIVSYLTASLSDKVGRRVMLGVGTSVTAIGVIGTALAVIGGGTESLIVIAYVITTMGTTLTVSVTSAQTADLADGRVPYRKAMAAHGLSLAIGKTLAVTLIGLTLWNPLWWIIGIVAGVLGGVMMTTAGTRGHELIYRKGTRGVDEAADGAAEVDVQNQATAGEVAEEPVGTWVGTLMTVAALVIFSFWAAISSGDDTTRYVILLGGQAIGSMVGNLHLSRLHTSFVVTARIGILAQLVGFFLVWTPAWVLGGFIWGYGVAVWNQELRTLVAVTSARGQRNGLFNLAGFAAGAGGAILLSAFVHTLGPATGALVAGGLALILLAGFGVLRRYLLRRKGAAASDG